MASARPGSEQLVAASQGAGAPAGTVPALVAADGAEADRNMLRSIFGQTYRQLHFLKPNNLRGSGQIWRVRYADMAGVDAGGLFRDSLTAVCHDLHSFKTTLFLPCPNGRNNTGENKEQWIPNPSLHSSLHLSMFAFVGKLLGVAIRGKHDLDLCLPMFLWRYLVAGQSAISKEDLEACNKGCFQPIELVQEALKGMADRKSNQHLKTGLELEEEEPDFFDLRFSINTSDGKIVELKANGLDTLVTVSNAEEFCILFEQYRFEEFEAQLAAIRKGLATIVPVQLLSLFTPKELELMVCGTSEIDIHYLQANTVYKDGLSPSDEHVQLFWLALESFSQEERQRFIRFCWGRNRLPLRAEDFVQKLKIARAGSDTNALPVSHTCFFELELPRYKTIEVMIDRLRYAINNTGTIALA